MSANFEYRTIDRRRDHISIAMLHAIERIDRFKPAKGDNAFAYFSSVVFNRLRNSYADEVRLQKRAVLFSDLEDRDQSSDAVGEFSGEGDQSGSRLERATPYAQVA